MSTESSSIAMQRDIEYLMSREAIRDLAVKYCRGIDRVDHVLVRSVFHDDARIHMAPWFDGSIDEYVEYFSGNTTGTFQGAWAHLVANQLIVIEGDYAECEWLFSQTDRVESETGADDLIMCARYLDRLERREGVWRVAERLLVHDIIRFDRVGRTWGEGQGDWWPDQRDAVFGERSSQDPSYGFRLLAGVQS